MADFDLRGARASCTHCFERRGDGRVTDRVNARLQPRSVNLSDKIVELLLRPDEKSAVLVFMFVRGRKCSGPGCDRTVLEQLHSHKAQPWTAEGLRKRHSFATPKNAFLRNR